MLRRRRRSSFLCRKSNRSSVVFVTGTDPAAAEGIPAHVTVVYPFLPVQAISSDVIQSLSELFAGLPQFHAEFSEIRRFPGVLYFAPNEDAPFRRLTERVVERYPEAPPYGGQFRQIRASPYHRPRRRSGALTTSPHRLPWLRRARFQFAPSFATWC